MDPVTHVLSGLAVSHAGFRQRIGRTAVVAVTAGALAPDLAFIVDPILTAAFAVPLVVAWRRSHLAARAVRIGLGAAVLYLALAGGAKAVAEANFVADLRQRVIAADRITVLPRLFSPFRWAAVAEAPGRLYQASVTPWPGVPVDLRFYSQAPRNGYVARSDATEAVRLFLRFARFPWTRYLRRGEDHIVEYRDLSFGLERTANDMVLRVVMDASGIVTRVDFNHRF